MLDPDVACLEGLIRLWMTDSLIDVNFVTDCFGW
jgi:hypothetical protein